jgi:hypothetical protein
MTNAIKAIACAIMASFAMFPDHPHLEHWPTVGAIITFIWFLSWATAVFKLLTAKE